MTSNGLNDYSVADFISLNGQWNETMLLTVFAKFEVEEILNILLIPNGVDRMFWKWDKKERYSVKSGYQL